MIKTMIKTYLAIMCLLVTCFSANAITVNVTYPNENITTELYYRFDGETSYQSDINNSVTGDLSVLIIKNQMEYDDIVNNPHKAIPALFTLIMILIISCVLVALAFRMKRLI